MVSKIYFPPVAIILANSAYGGIQALAVGMEEVWVVFEKHGFSSNITNTYDKIII